MSPDDCVRQMREKVQEETKLTVSAGIAPNKVRNEKSYYLKAEKIIQMLAKVNISLCYFDK